MSQTVTCEWERVVPPILISRYSGQPDIFCSFAGSVIDSTATSHCHRYEGNTTELRKKGEKGKVPGYDWPKLSELPQFCAPWSDSIFLSHSLVIQCHALAQLLINLSSRPSADFDWPSQKHTTSLSVRPDQLPGWPRRGGGKLVRFLLRRIESYRVERQRGNPQGVLQEQGHSCEVRPVLGLCRGLHHRSAALFALPAINLYRMVTGHLRLNRFKESALWREI